MGNCFSKSAAPSEKVGHPVDSSTRVPKAAKPTPRAPVKPDTTNAQPVGSFDNTHKTVTSDSREAAARAAQDRYDAQQARIKQSQRKLKGKK